MICPFCKHIIRTKDEICRKCGEKYPRARQLTGTCYCTKCGSTKINIKYEKVGL